MAFKKIALYIDDRYPDLALKSYGNCGLYLVAIHDFTKDLEVFSIPPRTDGHGYKHDEETIERHVQEIFDCLGDLSGCTPIY